MAGGISLAVPGADRVPGPVLPVPVTGWFVIGISSKYRTLITTYAKIQVNKS
jgi:hypothetical protein